MNKLLRRKILFHIHKPTLHSHHTESDWLGLTMTAYLLIISPDPGQVNTQSTLRRPYSPSYPGNIGDMCSQNVQKVSVSTETCTLFITFTSPVLPLHEQTLRRSLACPIGTMWTGMTSSTLSLCICSQHTIEKRCRHCNTACSGPERYTYINCQGASWTGPFQPCHSPSKWTSPCAWWWQCIQYTHYRGNQNSSWNSILNLNLHVLLIMIVMKSYWASLLSFR